MYSLSHIVRIISLKKNEMRSECRMHGREEKCIQSFGRNPKEGDHLEYLGVGGKIILKCILKRWDGRMCTGLLWLRTRVSERLFEHVISVWVPYNNGDVLFS